MAQYKNALVDIPEDKGIHIKSAGLKKEKYVYKYTRYFRNKDKKPRNEAKAIGKLDTVTGKMCPNGNYFEIYKIDVTAPDITVWDYGYTYLVLKVCRDIGLYDCLIQALDSEERALEIIAMAAYIIREGNVMDAIDDWRQRNYFPEFDRSLTSQTCSRAFASVTDSQQFEFFKLWVLKAFQGGSVFYDVTSISSYSQQMTDVERGYNRDGENLCQFNLGMFCDEISKTPLYYCRYNGSITDRTNLSYVLANARDIGIERVKMVLDGGFWSEECIKSLNKCCSAFTVGMPVYLKESEKILAEYSAGIEIYANELTYRHIYCTQVNIEIYGVAGRVLLFYDSLNHLKLCDELSDYIDKLNSELAELKRYPKSKLSRYSPYFTIAKHENDSGFDYAVDIDKVEMLRKTKGFFLLFSTDMDSSPSDILYYYRAKDADEKIFSQIKVDLDSNRIRTHNENTTDGKTFVIFIACIIRYYMLNKLSEYLNENSTSLKRVLNQLSNITVISNSNGIRFTKALTKVQKLILSFFNAFDDILLSLSTA
jgi:transposase